MNTGAILFTKSSKDGGSYFLIGNTMGEAMVALLDGQPLSMLSPNGGEQIGKGTTITVQWLVNSDITNVKLDYSLDAGATWVPIVASVPAIVGNYSWTVPDSEQPSVIVRVSSLDGTVFDQSNTPFGVVTPTEPIFSNNISFQVMVLLFKLIITLVRAIFQSKKSLVMELMAKNQQLSVYENTIKKVKLRNTDRRFWIALSRAWPGWRGALFIVRPETVIKWHKKGFRYYWKWISRRKGGRPVTNRELISLIKKLSRENPEWGNMRIRDELLRQSIRFNLVLSRKLRFRSFATRKRFGKNG